MKRLDDIIVKKMDEILFYYLVRIIKADMEVENITQITEDMIILFKEQYKIEGMIIDVDETLRKDMEFIPKCNRQWLEMVRKHFKIVFLSNGKDIKIQQYCDDKGIIYISMAFKPLSIGFKKACKKINVKPENVLVVGDNLIDDIFGAKKNKMKTIEVRDVEEDER